MLKTVAAILLSMSNLHDFAPFIHNIHMQLDTISPKFNHLRIGELNKSHGPDANQSVHL